MLEYLKELWFYALSISTHATTWIMVAVYYFLLYLQLSKVDLQVKEIKKHLGIDKKKKDS